MIILATGGIAGAVLASTAAPCRDRFLQPFSSASIWNTAIGSEAEFVPAGLFHSFEKARGCQLRANSPGRRTQCPGTSGLTPAEKCESLGCCYDVTSPKDAPACFEPAGVGVYPTQIHNDADWVVSASADDPMTPWMSQGSWGGGDNCAVTGPLATHVPFPADVVTGGHEENNAMGLLLPDNETLIQAQPFYRCGAGSPVLAQYQSGCPVPFPWVTSILGDGAWGAHGGSGLSAVGGTIRSGELAPGAGPIPHALKIEGFAHDQYSSGTAGQPWTLYRWPALGHDGYATNAASGLQYNGSNPAVVPGSLLAIPADVAANLTIKTVPGQRLLAALRDFGAYIVDDTASPSAAICMEASVSDEIRSDFNLTLGTYASGPAEPGQPLYEDVKALFQALHAVTNNGPGRVGGGGSPRVPAAPPICGA